VPTSHGPVTAVTGAGVAVGGGGGNKFLKVRYMVVLYQSTYQCTDFLRLFCCVCVSRDRRLHGALPHLESAGGRGCHWRGGGTWVRGPKIWGGDVGWWRVGSHDIPDYC